MAGPSDVLRAARPRQKLGSVLTTQRPSNVEPRVDGPTHRSCAPPSSAVLLAIAWQLGRLRPAQLVCASGSTVCTSSGVSTGFAEPWHLLRGVCQMYPSYVLLIMRGCIAYSSMGRTCARAALGWGGGKRAKRDTLHRRCQYVRMGSPSTSATSICAPSVCR